MSTLRKPIDSRPFQSRAARERVAALEAQYGSLAIPEVVAALQQVAGSHTMRPKGSEQAR